MILTGTWPRNGSSFECPMCPADVVRRNHWCWHIFIDSLTFLSQSWWPIYAWSIFCLSSWWSKLFSQLKEFLGDWSKKAMSIFVMFDLCNLNNSVSNWVGVRKSHGRRSKSSYGAAVQRVVGASPGLKGAEWWRGWQWSWMVFLSSFFGQNKTNLLGIETAPKRTQVDQVSLWCW